MRPGRGCWSRRRSCTLRSSGGIITFFCRPSSTLPNWTATLSPQNSTEGVPLLGVGKTGSPPDPATPTPSSAGVTRGAHCLRLCTRQKRVVRSFTTASSGTCWLVLAPRKWRCPTNRPGLIRQEYERYLPLPRLGEGRGEAFAVGSWGRPRPVRPLPREDLPKGIGLYYIVLYPPSGRVKAQLFPSS